MITHSVEIGATQINREEEEGEEEKADGGEAAAAVAASSLQVRRFDRCKVIFSAVPPTR
jgi:hypothetical protein